MQRSSSHLELGSTRVIYNLESSDAQPSEPDICAKIDGNFAIKGCDWTCYRTNYFSVRCSYTILPSILNGNIHLKTQLGGVGAQVHAFAMSLAAVDGTNGKPVELVQHKPKRDKGSQQSPNRITLRPRQPQQHGIYSLDTVFGGSSRERLFESPGLSPNPDQPATEAIFERIKFKTATANNGTLKGTQQYYRLVIELFADLGQQHSERWVRIATRMSAPTVVRGRNPGYYHKRGGDARTGPGYGIGVTGSDIHGDTAGFDFTVETSAACFQSGIGIQNNNIHECSDSRTPTGRNSHPVINELSSTNFSIHASYPNYDPFLQLPGLTSNGVPDIHLDFQKAVHQERDGGIISNMNTGGNFGQQNSRFAKTPIGSQSIPTVLDINSERLLGQLGSIAGEDSYTYIHDNAPIIGGHEEPERENMVGTTMPSLSPSVLDFGAATQAEQFPRGPATNLRSRPVTGVNLMSSQARPSLRSPGSFSIDSSLQSELDEACSAPKTVDYDSSSLDSFLEMQVKPKFRRQPNEQELLNTQIWGSVNPRKAWTLEQPASWLEEKREEIIARGGKKANFGRVITAQNRQERLGNGWSIHQCQESTFGTPEDLEKIKLVEAITGVENIKDMVLAVVDGVLCVVDPPEKDEESRSESSRVRRNHRCFPV